MWNLTPRGIQFDKNVDCSSPEEAVEDVNVVVLPVMIEVQELKRKVCTVGQKSGGGNEVFQEVSAHLSVEPLSG